LPTRPVRGKAGKRRIHRCSQESFVKGGHEQMGAERRGEGTGQGKRGGQRRLLPRKIGGDIRGWNQAFGFGALA